MKNKLRMAEGVFILTLLITLLVCPGLYAEEETLPTPEEIIAKNIEARGGKEALKKIKNIKRILTNKIIPINLELKRTIYQERPDKQYSLQENHMGISRDGSNGKIAWAIDPQNRARLFDGWELSMRLSNAKINQNLLFLFELPYKSMKTEGIEQINGKDCYKVVKTPEIGPEMTVYYDKKSLLKVKTTYKQISPQEKFNTNETYIEEYQKIDNILFEYKIGEFHNGKRVEEITIEIELNIEMPEGIFDIPEEVKAIMDKNETEPHAQQ